MRHRLLLQLRDRRPYLEVPMEQTKVKKPRKKKGSSDSESVETPTADAHTEKKDLKAELDDILDDIESVLEENAEVFVSNYRQAGGE
jgi:ubiquitin-like protein Pup